MTAILLVVGAQENVVTLNKADLEDRANSHYVESPCGHVYIIGPTESDLTKINSVLISRVKFRTNLINRTALSYFCSKIDIII